MRACAQAKLFESQTKKVFLKFEVCEWLLFHANSAISLLYHVANKLFFNEVRFVLDQHALLEF